MSPTPGRTLNFSQRKAIEEILLSRDKIQGLQGMAGTGKTVALETIRAGAEATGYTVEGFAPTSRAANQLRDAGISADTLQGFLAKAVARGADPAIKHLYMVDESSLASTKQMHEFLQRIGQKDRVLLIGDTRQHQAVEAGKPFEQLQQAGMKRALLDQIIRQKNPELLQVVEHLAKGDTSTAFAMLEEQGRVHEISDATHRIERIAREYASQPEGTLVVSPDNASRNQINQAVRAELQRLEIVSKQERPISVLVPRSEVTGADRAWASQYQVGDVLRYRRGSSKHGIAPGTYAEVIGVDGEAHRLVVRQGRRN